mgnify:CR=1 FL=1
MGNADALLMDYKIFNSTASQDLTITAGDTLHVEIAVTGGSLSYKIEINDDTKPLYEEPVFRLPANMILKLRKAEYIRSPLQGKSQKEASNLRYTRMLST